MLNMGYLNELCKITHIITWVLKRGERVFSKKLHYCELMVYLSSACIPLLSLILVVFKHAYHNCSNLVHLFTKIHWSILHCWWQRLNGRGHRQHRDKTVAWVHAHVSVCMHVSVCVCVCVSVWACECVGVRLCEVVWGCVCEYMSGKTKKWSARALVFGQTENGPDNASLLPTGVSSQTPTICETPYY